MLSTSNYDQPTRLLKLEKSVLLMVVAAILFYGIDYHVAKTLIHLAAISSLIAVSARVLFYRQALQVNRQLTLFLSTMLIGVVAMEFHFLLFDSDLEEVSSLRRNYVFPFIAMILILPTLSRHILTFRAFDLIIPAAGILLAAPGIYDYYASGGGIYRTGGTTTLAIVYGTNLSVVASICLIIMLRSHFNSGKWAVALSLLAYSISVFTIYLTGSRGPLLSLIIASTITLILWAAYIDWKKALKVLSGLLVLLALSASNFDINKRLEVVWENLFSEGKEHTSMGIRKQLWQGGVALIGDHPFSGVGAGNHDQYFQEKLREDPNFIDHTAINFRHLHNDLINYFAWFGIPVGLLLYCYILVPLMVFVRNRKRLKNEKSASWGLGISALTFTLNGLTNTPSMRALTVTLFIILISLILIQSSNKISENE